MNYILVWYRFKTRQTGFTYHKLIQWFSSGEVNVVVWINGRYVLLTVIKPTTIWNSLYQSCEAKQRICESEGHYMKHHSLRQKVWPSGVTAPYYEFFCLFLTRAKQEQDRGGLCHWEERRFQCKHIHKYYYHTLFMFTYLSRQWYTIYKSHTL